MLLESVSTMPRAGTNWAPAMLLESVSAMPCTGLLRSASVATLNASLSLKVDMAPRVLSECLKIPVLLDGRIPS